MIHGAHFLLYSRDPEADRVFLSEMLDFPSVDAGGGWLIFALPPAELGVHPAESEFTQLHAERPLLGAILYLMCDDLRLEVAALTAKGVRCSEIGEAEWGTYTTLALPSGGEIGLYQPTHATAIGL